MVQACIIASANMYEVPRPPRRGSHRPGPPPCHPTLNEDTSARSLYEGYHGYCDREPLLEPLPTRGLAHYASFPDEDDSWKRGGILPARRAATHNTRLGFPPDRPSLPSTVDDPYWRRRDHKNQASRDSSPMRSSSHQASAKPSPSLELLRHLNGRVPDRYALEQSILESYARAAPQSAACQSSQKRCLYPGCTKISVSRGLCRGHGGGRRCHVPSCTKSAQSRSNFCWAHGGGQRCDVEGCMRSRKSKHFCVAHLDREGVSPSSSQDTATDHRCAMRQAMSASVGQKTSVSRTPSPPVRALPSLGQALSSASRSAPHLPERGIKQLLNA